jgi:hypothetical protein
MGLSGCLAASDGDRDGQGERLGAESSTLSGAAVRTRVVASNLEVGDSQDGIAMSDDGNVVVVGAGNEDSDGSGVNSGREANNGRKNSGAAYVLRRSGPDAPWVQEAYLKASNPDEGDRFGNFVEISGDGNVVAIGVAEEDSNGSGVNGPAQQDDSLQDSGAVYVFRRDAQGRWAQEAYVKASNAATGDDFGWPVALNRDGSVLAVSALFEDGVNDARSDSGAVYVFRRSFGSWAQEGYLRASNADADDWFGFSLGLNGDGNLLAIGAPFEGSSATGVNGNQNSNGAGEAGAVYVFRASGGVWTQSSYIKASNTDEADYFGNGVALSSDGRTLAVGAPGEDSAARGMNGDQSSEERYSSGAVYVFAATHNSWQQQAYVKAAQADANDQLGEHVALSSDGTFLVAGAAFEDGSATHLNGNQALNDAPNTGAAYVFVRTGSLWSQQAYLKPDRSTRGMPAGSSIEFGSSVDVSADGSAIAVGLGFQFAAPSEGYVFTDP